MENPQIMNNGQKMRRSSERDARRMLDPACSGAGPARIKSPATLDGWWFLEPLFRQRGRLLLCGAATMLAGGALGWAFLRTSYTCTAQLVRHDAPVAADVYRPRDLATPTLVGMIQSSDLLQVVGAQSDPPLSAAQLAKRIQVTLDRVSDITTIAASAGRLQDAADLANRYAREVVAFTRGLQRKEASEADAYANLQLAGAESDLEALSSNGSDPLAASPEPVAPPDKLEERIESAREELADLLIQYTDAHPLVRAQRAKLAALGEQMAQSIRASRSFAESAAGATAAKATERQHGAVSAKAWPVRSPTMEREGLTAMESARALLAARQRTIRMYRDNPPGYFQVLVAAQTKDALVHKPFLDIVLLATLCGMIGLAGAAAEVVFWEAVDNRLKTAADVTRVTGLPVLASLGDLRSLPADSRAIWAFRTWTAFQSRLSLSSNHGLVCGLTSAESGGGRSTWIRLLAEAASKCGFRVLTIAARPTEPTPVNGDYVESPGGEPLVFDPRASTALTANVLEAPAQIAEKLMSADSPPVIHIPLPGWVWNLERRRQWQAALESWIRIENLVILVELPPAALPEAVLLGENLPNLIWLAESSQSDATETLEQLETLRHARCNLVGAVLNRAPTPMKSRFTRLLGSPALAAACVALMFAPRLSATDNFSVAASAQRAGWQERLTLGPGDVLDFHIFGQVELTREAIPIGPDGRITYLEAENIMAEGLTVDEFRDRLNEELGKYRRAPQAFVYPVAYRSKKYFVLGAVTQKGVYTLDRPITIIEAVARARGLETGASRGTMVELADFSRSFLARGGRHVPVDFEKLFLDGDLSQNIALAPDDYLYFPSSEVREVYVLGEVHNPGPLDYRRDLSALSAVAVRGGFTDQAWKGRLLVVRGSLNHPQTFVIDAADALEGKAPDFPLQPKDIVYVGSRPWLRAEELLDTAASAFVESAVVTWTGIHVGPRFQ